MRQARRHLFQRPSTAWSSKGYLAFGTDGDVPVSHLLARRESGQGPRRARAIDQSIAGMDGGCVGGPVGSVGGVWSWCAAVGTTSRNASCFFYSRIGFGVREVIAFLGDCPLLTVGRVVTTETNTPAPLAERRGRPYLPHYFVDEKAGMNSDERVPSRAGW